MRCQSKPRHFGPCSLGLETLLCPLVAFSFRCSGQSGAATNIPGLVLVLRYMGKRAAVILPASAGIVGLVAGYLVDLFMAPNLAIRSIMDSAALQGIGSGSGEILYDA